MQIKELQKGVSIIICSYNGAKKLQPTLEHLTNQRVSENINWEVIFIDNNSTDNSLELVDNFWKKNGRQIPIKVINEPKSGKYYALTRGVNEARYTYFITCDDDNWLSEDYVERAYNILEQDPYIGAVGGQSIANFESTNIEIPDWFIKDQERYAIGKQGEKSGVITSRKFIWGAGMVSHVSLYKRFYKNYPSLLINNKGHFIAEDTEYCLRLILRGYQLFYDESLIIKHFVPNERLTKEYNNHLNKNIKESYEILDFYLYALRIYGALADSKFSINRLKILTPIRFVISKKEKKRKHAILHQLLTNNTKNSIIREIKRFATDTSI